MKLFTTILRLLRSKARKISRKNARTCGKFCLISAHRPCKTRPACTACAAQHARRQRSARLSQRCIWHRDCATSAFESAQNFARKRANVWQILFDFGAPHMQNSAGVHCVRCATRTVSLKLAAESAPQLAPRLRRLRRSKVRKISQENARTFGNFV